MKLSRRALLAGVLAAPLTAPLAGRASARERPTGPGNFRSLMGADGWYAKSANIFGHEVHLEVGGWRGSKGAVRGQDDAVQVSSQQKQIRLLVRNTPEYRRHPNDDNVEATKRRSERVPGGRVPAGQTARWAICFKYDSDLVEPEKQFVVSQIHTGNGSPSLGIRVLGTGRLIATIRSSANYAGNGDTVPLGRLAPGEPCCISAEVRLDRRLGLLRIWRDGELVYEMEGTPDAPWGFGNPGATYLFEKGGVYSAGGLGRNPKAWAAVTFDNVRWLPLGTDVTARQLAAFNAEAPRWPWPND